MKIFKIVYEVYFRYNDTNLMMLDLPVFQNDKIELYLPILFIMKILVNMIQIVIIIKFYVIQQLLIMALI